MNRRPLVRLVLVAWLCAVAPELFAQQALEIIPLRHRTVDQVLPALQPLLEPGATLSGSRGQLFLRASPSNVDDIKRALAVIDRPAKRLQISVRLDDALQREQRDVRASGSIGSGGVRFSGSAQDSRSSAGERVDQRLQVMEGGRAMIATGSSNEYRDIASGFEVVPRLAGGGVLLDIVQQRETPGSYPGSVQGQRISTQVQARLGEWVEIGGTSQAGVSDQRAIGAAGSRQTTGSRRVWLKVEALD
jgi:type II secretory pathway component GspD/PulD (secretin)